MIGRAATDDPWIFARADSVFHGEVDPVATRHQAVYDHLDYLRTWQQRGVKLALLVAPMINLFAGERNARRWRRALSEDVRQPGATPDVLCARPWTNSLINLSLVSLSRLTLRRRGRDPNAQRRYAERCSTYRTI